MRRAEMCQLIGNSSSDREPFFGQNKTLKRTLNND